MIYSLYPEQNISVWIVNGRGGLGCSCAVGHSILNRTSNVNVGSLMLKYGGGGHDCASGATVHGRKEMKALIADADTRLADYKESNEGWL